MTVVMAHLPERLARRVRLDPSGCWTWTGYVAKRDGYARTSYEGRQTTAHRAFYQSLVGPIPSGMVLDHTCHDPKVCTPGPSCPHRRCVNPAHLDLVTPAENNRRGGGPTARNGRVTVCPQGHEYSPENTARTPQGRRRCRQCERDRESRRKAQRAEYRQRTRERHRLYQREWRARRAS